MPTFAQIYEKLLKTPLFESRVLVLFEIENTHLKTHIK
jgi:hypothetical protein